MIIINFLIHKFSKKWDNANFAFQKNKTITTIKK